MQYIIQTTDAIREDFVEVWGTLDLKPIVTIFNIKVSFN